MNSRPRPDSGITPRRTRGRKRPVSLTLEDERARLLHDTDHDRVAGRGRAVLDGVRDCLADGQLHLILVVLAEPELSRAALGEVTRLLEARHIGTYRMFTRVNPAIHRLQRRYR